MNNDEEIAIKLTKHAKIKNRHRKIALDDIKKVILRPELMEPDKFDKSLVHFIGNVEGKFLRVIGRWKSKKDLLVISSFFDRRLKRRIEHDKN